MAMEKLHELLQLQRYQTLIVDTPPSAHARDLLAAPNRLTTLLASRAVSLFAGAGQPAVRVDIDSRAVGARHVAEGVAAVDRPGSAA